ncbi:unnamed protein product [Brassica rapa subsp. narinosa]
MKPHDDWVDGSWTVDCVCGVNFDDGKEMVNCDECGVWVHTWCSRYAKGDDLFACHKCKIKNTNGFMLKEVPIEERVHVQGVPGGDLSLFENFSSVSSRQLWKCSGYVPKKFRFQYREFACWDDHEKGNACETEDPEDGSAPMNEGRIRNFVSTQMEMKCFQNDDINKETYFSEDRVKKKVKVADKEEEDDHTNDLVGNTLKML